ncbi:MAG: hypothetical protein ACNYPI_06520 [Arenicellales bacterium WSBS_2016_MAG_OTU3]
MLHNFIFALSCVIIFTEFSLLVFYRELILDWVSHNLWVVILPFAKGLFKKIVALKMLVFVRSISILLWHLSKLFLLKILKTLGIRYGVFFSQNRWYWIRRIKVMFIRRGKRFFRSLARFWDQYQTRSKWTIFVAFFPVAILLFFLGLSFNITRKTMVQKTQEAAIFKMATKASIKNHGVRAWVSRLDEWALLKIQEATRARSASRRDR